MSVCLGLPSGEPTRLGEILAFWCDRDPTALAIETEHARWSRAEFAQTVDALDDALGRQGVQAGDVVAWLGLNSVPMLAALWACERLGAVFMPLNWRLSDAELAAQLHDAGTREVLGSPELAERRAALRGALRPRAGRVAADDLLLVYTSGTTGQPRGALHTRAQMLANARAAIDAQGLRGDERTLSVLPLFHVGGLCIQTLPTLLVGGAVFLPARFDPGQWLATVASWRATTSLLVPAVMRALVEHPAWAQADLSALRFVNSGSSVIPRSLIDAFQTRRVPVAQVYGSTETGPVSIVLTPQQAMVHPGLAGQPALGVSVRLVGDDGADVAPGHVGEILVRGPNVMRGYIGQELATCFQDGWFATGDLARRGDHGLYEVVGRRKDIVISGGEKVYPAEIEALLEGFPGLAECAVVGVPDRRWGEVPALAAVARPGTALQTAALLDFVSQRLARYKVPKHVAVVASLPRTALGKVQKPLLAQQLSDQFSSLGAEG